MKWRYGCGEIISVYVPKGWDYKERKVECGSTSHTGGVYQCAECAEKHGQPRVPEYGDIEHDY
jgi:hypothetical protein